MSQAREFIEGFTENEASLRGRPRLVGMPRICCHSRYPERDGERSRRPGSSFPSRAGGVYLSLSPGLWRIRTLRLRRWTKAVSYLQIRWNCFPVGNKGPSGFIHACLEKLTRNLPNSLSVVWAWRRYGRSNWRVGRCSLIHVPLRPGGIVRKRG